MRSWGGGEGRAASHTWSFSPMAFCPHAKTIIVLAAKYISFVLRGSFQNAGCVLSAGRAYPSSPTRTSLYWILLSTFISHLEPKVRCVSMALSSTYYFHTNLKQLNKTFALSCHSPKRILHYFTWEVFQEH